MKPKLIYITGILLLLTSCRSSLPSYNYKELARAGITLGIDIDLNDYHKLYIESANWIGSPYRHGGNSKHGTDCSGLTSSLYKNVYHIKLPRSTNEQIKVCHRIKKNALKEGDLVFFHGTHSKRKPTHVGIYLKDGNFIHASNSHGVIVSNLNENYYHKYWLSGGRINRKKRLHM